MKFITFFAFVSYAFIIQTESLTVTDGTEGIRLWCKTEEQVDYLVQTFLYDSDFDFLKLTFNDSDVIVASHKLDLFKSNLNEKNIQYEVVIKNMKKHLEDDLNEKRISKRNANFLNSFPRFQEIDSILSELLQSHPDIMQYYSIGQSSEGRDIMMVEISSGGQRKNQAILIDAGIHAREWITPTTALYAIKELVTNPNNRDLFEEVDIYIAPLINPDGYEYSHSGGSEARMWRKTRSRRAGTNCVGVDANRNFDFQWMKGGSSDDPCHDLYAGPHPFSEPETDALKEFFETHSNIKAYLTLHSYGLLLLYPWGYTKEKLHNNYDTHKCVAKEAVAKLNEVRGIQYTTGITSIITYLCSGTSQDWAMNNDNVKLSYTMELPSTAFKFEPPVSHIEPIGQETFEAIKVLIKKVEEQSCCVYFDNTYKCFPPFI